MALRLECIPLSFHVHLVNAMWSGDLDLGSEYIERWQDMAGVLLLSKLNIQACH